MLDEGEVRTQTELAAQLGLTRVRVTQFLNLLELPVNVQEFLINTRDDAGQVTERAPRKGSSSPAYKRLLRKI